MHNKITKAVTASLMAAAMLTTTVATIAPMSVSAGQVLGENDFIRLCLGTLVKLTRLSRHLS